MGCGRLPVDGEQRYEHRWLCGEASVVYAQLSNNAMSLVLTFQGFRKHGHHHIPTTCYTVAATWKCRSEHVFAGWMFVQSCDERRQQGRQIVGVQANHWYAACQLDLLCCIWMSQCGA